MPVFPAALGYKQRKEALTLFTRGWMEYYKLARQATGLLDHIAQALGRAQTSLALLSLLEKVHHADQQGDDGGHGGTEGTDRRNGLLRGTGLRGYDDLTTGFNLRIALGSGDRTILIENISA